MVILGPKIYFGIVAVVNSAASMACKQNFIIIDFCLAFFKKNKDLTLLNRILIPWTIV